jgi:hypothetical protein
MSIITVSLLVIGFLTFMTIAIALLPTAAAFPLPVWMAASTTLIVGYINDLYAVFPQTTTAVLVTFAFVFVASLLSFGWSAVRFLIRLVRGARV